MGSFPFLSDGTSDHERCLFLDVPHAVEIVRPKREPAKMCSRWVASAAVGGACIEGD
jgi:hypothetical protein